LHDGLEDLSPTDFDSVHWCKHPVRNNKLKKLTGILDRNKKNQDIVTPGSI